MLKYVLLFCISCSVYAIPNKPERKVPIPDAAEKGEMVCFNSSQALHKVLTSLRGGTSAAYITSKVKQNGANFIADIKANDNIIHKKANIDYVNRTTKLALSMVTLAKDLDKNVKPSYAAAVYYDECAKAIH